MHRYARWPIHLALIVVCVVMLTPFYWVLKTSVSGENIFAYPPTFRTFQETLREVKRCTQEHIVINTFMLERSHYLADFVNQMTRINRGRAFFISPDRLGDYILIDYVSQRGRAA